MEQIIAQTVAVLRRGGTILYPTDTIWGLGCDARNRDAVERLYAIKQRDHSKSMLVLCTENIISGRHDLFEHSGHPDSRPTTYILPAGIWQPLFASPLADNLAAADGSLGVRLVRHDFCRRVEPQCSH